MSDSSRDERVVGHITKIASRTDYDHMVLADSLQQLSWPGGADRTEPSAVAWLRRWRPKGPELLPVLCGCADGRCLVCN